MPRFTHLALLLALPACGGEAPVPPNILLVTVDTLRADHLGCYGYERRTSPNIDALAERSVRFERAYVQWPKTGPSIASLMTSTYGSTSGVMRQTGRIPVPRDFDTLAERLAAQGYETLASVTNPSLTEELNYDQGFDTYVLHYDPERTWDHQAARVLGRARELLEARRSNVPYFLWVHLLDPHGPYRPGPKWYEPFTRDATYLADERPPIPLAPDVLDPDAPSSKPVGQLVKRFKQQDLVELRDYVARYDGEIAYMDAELGAFLDWARDDGQLEHTVVVFTADHGEGLGDHEIYFEHGRYPYDACGHVPLLIEHPGATPGVVSEPVALLDLAPTLLDIAGARPGAQFEGASILARLLGGPPPESPTAVFAESGYLHEFSTSVRLGEWKLIRLGSQTLIDERLGEPYELYDVDADPAELVNLVHAQPDVTARLRALLDPWTERAYAKVPPGAEDVALPEDLERKLRSLGYVDGE